MADLKKFMYANQLKQVDIARYLEISEASVSRVIKGFGKLAPENLAKLLENNRGWDTSALTEEPDAVQIVGHSFGNETTQIYIAPDRCKVDNAMRAILDAIK